MRRLKYFAVILVLLAIVYLSGPHPSTPIYNKLLPQVPSVAALDSFILANEITHKLRPNNQARVVWANDIKVKTDFAIVYLHGFSASQEEGDPVHKNIAKKFGCNLYLSRLAEHGLDTTDQMINLTADKYWESAKEALVIGKQIGYRVILMGTSTGATQAIQLAAAFPGDIAGLILYSPNIAINDPNAWLLNNPWGLQIARMVKGNNFITPVDQRPVYKQYWSSPYRLEAVVQLEEMLETSMNDNTYSRIFQPTLMLYYYKDMQHQDEVVKVSAMLEMFGKISTPESQKISIAIPNAGNHVIASPIKSNDIRSVEYNTEKFLSEVMHINKVEERR